MVWRFHSTRTARLASQAIIALATLEAASAGYQALADARDWRRHPSPGRLVEVGRRRPHIFDAGLAPPVVVIGHRRQVKRTTP